MVAIRRVKYIIKLSAVALLALTCVIFQQWDEIAYTERVKQYMVELKKGHIDHTYDQDIQESERELDVDEVLKKIKDDVHFQLSIEDNLLPKRKARKHELENNIYGNAAVRGKYTQRPVSSLPHLDKLKQFETSPNSIKKNKKTVPPLKKQAKNNRAKSCDWEHRRHMKYARWKTYPWQPEMRGQLNVHVWQAWCGNTIHDLRRNWFYPSYPDLHLTVRRFFVQHYENDYGQRVFGYIHPPLTGRYVFALSSDDTSELWLSSDEHPENAKILSWVGNRTRFDGLYRTNMAQFTKYRTQISRPVFLKQGHKYFVEALHKQGINEDHLLVGWKIPGFPGFRFITGDSISMYIDDRKAEKDVTEYAKYIPQTLPSHTHSHSSNIVLDRGIHKFGTGDFRGYDHLGKFVDPLDVKDVLPHCSYEPSYLVDFTLGRYDGVKLIHDSAVYPDDNSELTHMKPYDRCLRRRLQDSHGNKLKFHGQFAANDSLYEEGRIRVFSDGDGVSVVTSPEDWEMAYPTNNGEEPDVVEVDNVREMSNTAEQDKTLRNVYEEITLGTPSEKQDRLPLINDKIQGQKINQKISQVNLGNMRKHYEIQLITLQNEIRRVQIRSEVEKPVFAAQNVKQRSGLRKSDAKVASTSGEQLIRNRGGGDRVERHHHSKMVAKRVSNSKIKTKVTRTKKITSSRQRNSEGARTGVRRHPHEVTDSRLQRKRRFSGNVNEKEHPSRTKNQLIKSRSRKVKHNQSGTRRSSGRSQAGRKLLNHVGVEEDDEYDNDIEEPPVLMTHRTHQSIARLYFQPVESVSNNGSMSNFVSEDAYRSRINMAREYVHRMQKVVQHYDYHMTARQMSDQIFRRYGIRMKVPPLHPVHYYNPWLYNHNITKCTSDGNLLLNPEVAKSVVNRYMKVLNEKTGDKYSLQRIVNLEENHDIMNGDRYLIELDLHVKDKNSSVLLSQYIYQKIGENKFCQPHNFKLNEHATVHVIVPVKNQGRWVQYFIDDMSELYQQTGDPHLNIIIVDFESDDIDIQAALERSALRRLFSLVAHCLYPLGPHSIVINHSQAQERHFTSIRYRLIKLEGVFQRAYGIQAGTTVVTNPHDIIFMCDLHLELPNNMIDIIRKHCVERRMAFAPIVTRLHCGFTPSIPYGFWELQGYGLFAMYMSDFTRVGGMNYREFGARWGGEDWELLDRVLSHKLEVERLRIPHFYHFYHSKKGMWGTPTIEVVSSDITEYYSSNRQIIPLWKDRPFERLTTVSGQNVQLRERNSRPVSRVKQGSRPERSAQR